MVYGKEATRSLIRYFSKIEMGGCFTERSHKAIFELARQLTGPQLLKVNPKLVFDLQFLPEEKPAYLKVEYINGSKIDLDPISLTCQELRDEVFWVAEGIELDLDLAGNNPIVGEDDDDGAADAKSTKKK
jgi:hypothetical protein